MKTSTLVLAALISSSCTANEKQIHPSEIYKILSNQIIKNEECFYEQDPESEFQVSDERLIIKKKLSDKKDIILAICAPGMYQDSYIGFLVEDNNISTAEKLTFGLPEFDERTNSWKLVNSQAIPGLVYPRQNDKFILINKSGCAGSIGYMAEYDQNRIEINKENIPTVAWGNGDCGKEIGPADWPEIEFKQ